MRMKGKILVTGGIGYIGSHTVVELIKQNYEVVIIDNLSNSEEFILNNIEHITGKRPIFYKADLLNVHKLEYIFTVHPDIKGVIHFAASKAVGESVNIPLYYYRNNVVTMLNLLEKMQHFNVTNLVFSSSCTVYGQPDKLPVSEKAPIKPAKSPYGYTKQICENILKDLIKSDNNIKGCSLRYFNPIGAHESGLLGELPKGVPNNLMPFITQTAYKIRDELSVFGNDYDTPDGSCVRDYIHVVDLAKAHIKSLERMINNSNKTAYEIFNIGTGTGYSVLNVIKSFEKNAKLNLNYNIVKRRTGDIEQIWANTMLAATELEWKAEKTLDEMTDSAWKWEKYYRNI